MNFKIYHDGFKWVKGNDVDNFKLSSGSYVHVDSVSINKNFLVGRIKTINNELLNDEMPFGVIHVPSSNILTIWESAYQAQVYADTLTRMKEDWGVDKIVFNTPFEYALFQSLPRLVHIAIDSGSIPVDEDLIKFGNKYIN